MKVCAIVPVYRHAQRCRDVLAGLRQLGLPCVLIDDGNEAADSQQLERLALEFDAALVVHRLNLGKGAAVIAGMRQAAVNGYTHALQIDADGQHDVADAARLLEAAAADPSAVVTGIPTFDASVPRSRLYGRYATHVWVWINTLSCRIIDAMCGYRVYPIGPILELIAAHKIGLRMEFDVELLVRLDWEGVRIISVPVRVTYPPGSISNFRLWRDNILISKMHARLFFGMLRRMPRLVRRQLPSWTP